jgi:hypothetical protein
MYLYFVFLGDRPGGGDKFSYTPCTYIFGLQFFVTASYNGPFQLLQILGEHVLVLQSQLLGYDLQIPDRIDVAFDVRHVVVLERP